MDEKTANEKRLSDERLESSPEVDKALYKHTIIIMKNNKMTVFSILSVCPLFFLSLSLITV